VATTLCTCAALGLKTRYVGSFGSDDHGRLIRSELEQRGVETSHSAVRYAPNRHAVILVDERTGERTIAWHRDAALALQPRDLAPEALAGARLLHVDNVDEEMTTDVDVVTDTTGVLIAAATLPVFAAHVPEVLTGQTDPRRALRELRRQYGAMLCVTLGSRGAMLLAGDELFEAPAFRVEAIDTTGAGDVFRGALIFSLLRGDPPESMLRFANAAAAVSCTREGAIASVPNLQEIDRLVVS
jgi:sugar/nucleoside kinase (ribokinase family)